MVHWYGFMPLGTEQYVAKGDIWLETPDGEWYQFNGKDWKKYEKG